MQPQIKLVLPNKVNFVIAIFAAVFDSLAGIITSNPDMLRRLRASDCTDMIISKTLVQQAFRSCG